MGYFKGLKLIVEGYEQNCITIKLLASLERNPSNQMNLLIVIVDNLHLPSEFDFHFVEVNNE